MVSPRRLPSHRVRGTGGLATFQALRLISFRARIPRNQQIKSTRRLLRHVSSFFFEKVIEVAFSVPHPNHPNPALVSQVIDAQILKSLDGPGSKAPESFPGKALGRAALRRPDDLRHRFPDGAEEAFGRLRLVLLHQVVAELA